MRWQASWAPDWLLAEGPRGEVGGVCTANAMASLRFRPLMPSACAVQHICHYTDQGHNRQVSTSEAALITRHT